MRVIPHCTRRYGLEYVAETGESGDWALCDVVYTVHPGRVILVHAVPVDSKLFIEPHVCDINNDSLVEANNQCWSWDESIYSNEVFLSSRVNCHWCAAVIFSEAFILYTATGGISSVIPWFKLAHVVDKVGTGGCIKFTLQVSGRRSDQLITGKGQQVFNHHGKVTFILGCIALAYTLLVVAYLTSCKGADNHKHECLNQHCRIKQSRTLHPKWKENK